MKGNPDGSISNDSSLRTLEASGFIDSLIVTTKPTPICVGVGFIVRIEICSYNTLLQEFISLR